MEKTFEFATSNSLLEELLGSDLVTMMKDHGRVTFTKLDIGQRAGFSDVVDISYTVEFPDEEGEETGETRTSTTP